MLPHRLRERYVDMLGELAGATRDNAKFTKLTLKYAENILGVTNIKLFFPESSGEKLICYEKDKKNIYSGDQSVASYVVNMKKLLVLPDINSFAWYNKKVDISSQYPVYTYPIFSDGQFGVAHREEDTQESGTVKREISCVIQLALKSGGGTSDMYNCGLEDFNRDDSAEQLLIQFVKILGASVGKKC